MPRLLGCAVPRSSADVVTEEVVAVTGVEDVEEATWVSTEVVVPGTKV